MSTTPDYIDDDDALKMVNFYNLFNAFIFLSLI